MGVLLAPEERGVSCVILTPSSPTAPSPSLPRVHRTPCQSLSDHQHSFRRGLAVPEKLPRKHAKNVPRVLLSFAQSRIQIFVTIISQ